MRPQDIRNQLDPLDRADLIATACKLMLGDQKELGETSGITAGAIHQIKTGRKATNCQRAAIYWAVASKML
ncbi:MAG: hypothetical protein LC676_08385 [Loktanella sp.]|nr:hypothetical protein [Loktanella sp.]